ncbi:Dolichyl-diphosphooligosaccharide--protein glycosyltransferase subunit 4 [Rhypophila decipiens]|uniref:Dolichyl-diphosphooligosaccharide--protein glycosyltransferase subunit 4 n=1 Tax=Rhypophila decipiens TaxID=261697 RepID=A0AAN6Y4L5_9PEZI|nr:Dolichyl-diphosphooligosaccharide--protein glycosyltransferase subunit 4 [Rhypophila decipiens]
MISDDELYRLAVFLGSAAMVLIVVYNFFEVNAQSKGKTSVKVGPQSTSASAKSK